MIEAEKQVYLGRLLIAICTHLKAKTTDYHGAVRHRGDAVVIIDADGNGIPFVVDRMAMAQYPERLPDKIGKAELIDILGEAWFDLDNEQALLVMQVLPFSHNAFRIVWGVYVPPDKRVLPLWKCHKLAEAVKIARIKADVFGAEETSWQLLYYNDDDNLCCIGVKKPYMTKYNPQIGGYYVRDEDGCENYSPAEKFEKDHARIASPFTLLEEKT